jgi:hypothetical protein
MTENEDNESGDELDFYDFLEVVEDKFDSIAQKSKREGEMKTNFVVCCS